MKIYKIILSIICALACSPAAMAEGLFGGGPFHGFYVGGQGGYGASDAEAQDTVGIGLSLDVGTSGGMYGFLGGWGTTLPSSSIYIGIEGQYNFVDRDGELVIGIIPATIEWETDEMWSVGGRLGYLLGENTMAFVRGAYANLDSEVTLSPGPAPNVEVDTFEGYEIGFGVEHHLGQNFTLRGEYVYSDYGSSDIDLEGTGNIAEVDDVSSEGRISVNYSF